MYRKRTVEGIIRSHERERAAWAIKEQNLLDRIMLLADRPWTPPPVEMSRLAETPEDPYEDFAYAEAVSLDDE
jgi:hypothetical protein